MSFEINNNIIYFDNITVKILKLINYVGEIDNMITGVYDILYINNEKDYYRDDLCIKITTRKIDLDSDKLKIIRGNKNFIEILDIKNNVRLNKNLKGFKKNTIVDIMIMEKINYTFADFCSKADRKNFHACVDLMNYLTYTLITTMNYLISNNLYYLDLKLENIGVKIDENNNIAIKIIDIDSIAYPGDNILATETTSPFFYYNDGSLTLNEMQLYVIVFTIFQLIFNNKYYNICKQYYLSNDRQVYSNFYQDPAVNYSLMCSNFKIIITTYINKLLSEDDSYNYAKFFEVFGNNIIINDKQLNEFINNLFYIVYSFKRSNQENLIGEEYFKYNTHLNNDNLLEFGNSSDIGTKIIINMIQYLNVRNIFVKITNPGNFINIKTLLNPTVIEDITIEFNNKISDNKYDVIFTDKILNYSKFYTMAIERIDNETINFIKNTTYFNNIKFNVNINNSLKIFDSIFNNVQLIIYRELVHDEDDDNIYDYNNIVNIINNLIYIVNDLYSHGYYYNFNLNNIFISHDHVQLINYSDLYRITNQSYRDIMFSMFYLILNIITERINEHDSITNPLVKKLSEVLSTVNGRNEPYFNRNVLMKLNYLLDDNNYDIELILEILFNKIEQGKDITEINGKDIDFILSAINDLSSEII